MAKASKEIIQKHEQMFYPTVRVRTKKAGGSGTVVYSKKHKDEVDEIKIKKNHPKNLVFKLPKKVFPCTKIIEKSKKLKILAIDIEKPQLLVPISGETAIFFA